MSTVKEIAKKLQQKYPNAFIGIGSDFINTQCGIYSISVDGVTRYIGETSRPFYKRFNEHWEMIFKPNDPQYSYMRIYKYLHSCYETGAVI